MPHCPQDHSTDEIRQPADEENYVDHKELPFQSDIDVALCCAVLGVASTPTTGHVPVDAVGRFVVQYRIDEHHQEDGQVSRTVVGKDSSERGEEICKVMATGK